MQQTVEGEPLEIYPFLGSSRLEEPLNRYPVSLVVHGHAHRGQLQGATTSGVPVYNVSMPLLTRSFTDRPPFRIFEVPVERPGETAARGHAVRRVRCATSRPSSSAAPSGAPETGAAEPPPQRTSWKPAPPARYTIRPPRSTWMRCRN